METVQELPQKFSIELPYDPVYTQKMWKQGLEQNLNNHVYSSIILSSQEGGTKSSVHLQMNG